MQTSALLAAAILLLPAAPALAESHSWQVGNSSFHIQTEDLNLSTATGRAQELARVESAAARLCRDAGVRSEVRECQAKLVQAAANGAKGGTLNLALAERSGAPTVLAQAK